MTFSFGKNFPVTSCELGYAITSPNLTERIRQVHQWNVFSVNSFTQMAIADYLSDEKSYNSLPAFYQQKRDLFNALLEGSSLKPIPCKGTYFQLFDYSEISDKSDIAFSEWLVKEHKVATIPISPFYSTPTDTKLIRVCFAKTEEVLRAAAEVLKKV